jgi:hypothetical protein
MRTVNGLDQMEARLLQRHPSMRNHMMDIKGISARHQLHKHLHRFLSGIDENQIAIHQPETLPFYLL